MQNDPENTVTPDNDELTAVERAELTKDTETRGAPTTEPAAAAAPAAQPPQPVQEPEPKIDPTAQVLAQVVETQERTAATLDAVARALPKAEAPAPVADATPQTPAEPDWDAEKKALKARYDANEIDDDEYESEREALLERKAEHRAGVMAAKAVNERLEKDEQAKAQQRAKDLDKQWDDALKNFGAVEANARLLTDPTCAAAFAAVLGDVAAESPGIGYDAMLAETATRIRKAFNLPAAPTDTKQVIKDAVDQRRPPPAPVDLSRAPAAGGDDIRSDPYQAMDELDIDSLENELARKGDDFIDDYLASAPGGLKDNPRA